MSSLLPQSEIALLLTAVLSSLILVAVYRRIAIKLNLVDVPGERSSHQLVTPRGAGIVIVLFYALGILELWATNAIASPVIILAVFPVLIALLGVVDDWLDLSAMLRLLSYFLIIAGVVFSLGVPAWITMLSPLLWVLLMSTVLLWVINLFNFMDGINGIAGFESLFFLFSAVIVDGAQWAALPPYFYLTVGAIIGFLFWNFPAGKVFMGDAGSIFLGALMAVYLVRAAYDGSYLFWSYAILLGVFIVDASYTLFVRLLSGQNITQAHRSHAYQILSRRWNSHARVVFVLMLINIVWLLPLALLVTLLQDYGLIIAILAYLPLVFVSYRLGAGSAAAQVP